MMKNRAISEKEFGGFSFCRLNKDSELIQSDLVKSLLCIDLDRHLGSNNTQIL